jgi:hypothetical protein
VGRIRDRPRLPALDLVAPAVGPNQRLDQGLVSARLPCRRRHALRRHDYVHFLRNTLDYVPRKVDDDCLRELRWLYDRRDLAEARRDLAAWLTKWQATYPKLCSWVEEHI